MGRRGANNALHYSKSPTLKALDLQQRFAKWFGSREENTTAIDAGKSGRTRIGALACIHHHTIRS